MERWSKDIYDWFTAIKKGKLANIQKLSKNLENIDVATSYVVNEVEHDNVTGLIFAAYLGNKDVVRWFLANKANPCASTHLGWQAVHFAAKRGHVATVDMLVSSGATVNNRTLNNETPILLALHAHMWDTVRKLVQLGASFDERSEAIFIQNAQKGYLSMDLLGKRKDTRPYAETSLSAQMVQISISKSPALADFHTQSLHKQLQYQNFSYDVELSRQKREIVSRLQNLPLPVPARSSGKFCQLVRRVVNASTSQSFRLTAAKQALDILQQTDSSVASLKGGKSNRGGVTSSGIRVLEDYVHVMELSACEKHCPDELAVLLAELCVALVVLYDMYSPPASSDEGEDVIADGGTESNNAPPASPNVLKISYVSKILRSIASSQSAQFRAGMLSFISRIVVLMDPSDSYDHSTAVTLISDLVVLTDSLDQPGNVSRLTRFVSLLGVRFTSEFGRHFTDLADILVGWCVDPSSIHRGVAVGALLEEITHNLSTWWFDYSDKELHVSEATSGMLGHLLEDADSCLQKAVFDLRQVFTNNAHVRRGTSAASSVSRPISSTEITQNLIAANLYFSVLSGICRGVSCFATSRSVTFASFPVSQWLTHLFSVLNSVEAMSLAASVAQKPSPSAPKTHVPHAYTLPLLTYGKILASVHSVLLFTVTTVNFEGDHLRQKIAYCLSRSPDESVLVPSEEHVKTLCGFSFHLLEHSPPNAPGMLISTFNMVLGGHSMLHRLKTNASGSAHVFALLVKLSGLHLAECDMLAMVTEMCISDFQVACNLLKERCTAPGDELLLLFSLSLFVTILKPVCHQHSKSPFVLAANTRILLIFADLQRRFPFFKNLSPRVRLSLLVTIISAINCGVAASSDCVGDLLFILKHMLATTFISSLQELVLLSRLLEKLSRSLGEQLSQEWCDYLGRLMKSSQSPVRAQDGRVFLSAVDLLIRLTADHPTAPRGVFKLITLCSNHPLPSIQFASTDLLLAFGNRIKIKHELTETANIMFHWFTSAHPEISTSLLTSASVHLYGYQRVSSGAYMSTHGSFPSLPAVAGVLGILTRAAPYASEDRTSRLGILSDSHDWLRRLACLVAPLPVDEHSRHNWYAVDVSPWAMVVLFSTWSMVEYKLKVAPWANPVKTFLAIEAVIHALLGQLSPKYQSSTPELQSFLTVTSTALGQQSHLRQFHQCGLLIQFLWQLEKTMINALDGFALALPSVNTTAQVFFRANAPTCHQWLNRIRSPLACLATWTSPIQLVDGEMSAAVIWSTYSLLYQVTTCGGEGTTAGQQQWWVQLSRLGTPEKIIIFLVQALLRVGASEELDLLHGFLERAMPAAAAGTPAPHPFNWVSGVACMTRGRLDEGLSRFVTFLKNSGNNNNNPSASQMESSCRTYVRHLLVAYCLRSSRANYLSEALAETSSAVVVCNSKGDAPPTPKADATVGGDLPIRYPDISGEQLRAMKKMATWNDCVEGSGMPTSMSLITRLEDQLLQLPPSGGKGSESEASILAVTENIRKISAAVGTQLGVTSPQTLTPETSLPRVLLKVDLAMRQVPQLPSDLDLECWAALAPSSTNVNRTEAALTVCEGLLSTSKDMAASLLTRQLTALGLGQLPPLKGHIDDQFEELVGTINEKPTLSSIDRLSLIRCLCSLLWEHGERFTAMTCLARGLLRSVLESNASDKVAHAGQCLLNSTVALQLFRFLETPSDQSRTLCREIFDTCAAELALGNGNDAKNSESTRLVQQLLQFSRLSSAPWVDGVPLVPPTQRIGSSSHLAKDFLSTHGVSGAPNEVSMRLLMFATRLSPTNASASAWLQMANWCYDRGRHNIRGVCEASQSILDGPASPAEIPSLFPEVLTDGELTSFKESVTAAISSASPNTSRCLDVSWSHILARTFSFFFKTDFNFGASEFCAEDLGPVRSVASRELRTKFAAHILRPPKDSTTTDSDPLPLGGVEEGLFGACASLLSSSTSRLYAPHCFAAQAYVTYLTVAGQLISEGGGKTASSTSSTKPTPPTERVLPLEPTTATSRLLCLLNEPSRQLRSLLRSLMVHGSAAETTRQLSPALSTTAPTATFSSTAASAAAAPLSSHSGPVVWAACLPQLLVRLSGHPDGAVRQTILELLCRLIRMPGSTDASSNRALANRLVFPAIVGCRGVDSAFGLEAGTTETQEGATSLLPPRARNHSQLLAALCEVTPGRSRMVEQVLSFVTEARRLAILWEELWSGALIQHLEDLNKKASLLDQELKRIGNFGHTPSSSSGPTKGAVSLATPSPPLPISTPLDEAAFACSRKLKYQALLTPTFTVFRQLSALTLAVPPETSHEAWFQATFKPLIDATLASIHKFCAAPSSADGVTHPVNLIHRLINCLQTMSQPLGATSGGRNTLHLAQLSPRLASTTSSSSTSIDECVPLPGRAYLSLARISPRVTLFHTKTRPKRLLFLTHNGTAYPYLLKCLEDLRLDSRVMQLSRLTNIALRSSSDRSTTVRTYSVTPLGPRAGLIQMVQGAVPLFSLYKRWQQRRANDEAGGTGGQPMKPAELFFAKLREHLPPGTPLTTAARSSWPKDVLRKTFQSLQAATPSDLLTRELWASSCNLSSWWHTSQTFALSLGLTSAFGYLMGLGDRHLDNLLIDLATGRLVHIDFNVCFDAGRSLRVPELVPFRLTRILRHPLGPFFDPSANAGGTFKAAFATTLQTTRAIAELIRVQLQCFVIDPLAETNRTAHGAGAATAFDLTYLGAYRGGCLDVSVDLLPASKRLHLTKRRRIQERLIAEQYRGVGLLAARFAELGGIDGSAFHQVSSLLEGLESTLVVWCTYKEKESTASRLSARIAVLAADDDSSLAHLQMRISSRDNAQHRLADFDESLRSFADDIEVGVTEKLEFLSRWLNPPTGIFCLPVSGADSPLAEAIADYRSVARTYILPRDSRFHLHSDNREWFAYRRRAATSLRECLLAGSPSLKSCFIEKSAGHLYSRVDREVTHRLDDALIEAKGMHESLQEQAVFPSTQANETIASLLAQGEANLHAFVANQQNPTALLPGFKWALMKHLDVWIQAMFVDQADLTARVDFLHQHTGVIASVFALLDSGHPNALPFWAGQEADAQSELNFFLTVHEFVFRIVQLRDSLFSLLPQLEDALLESSSSNGLLDKVGQIIVDSTNAGADAVQFEVEQLLTNQRNRVDSAEDHRLSQVLLAIHMALSNATVDLDALSRRMADFPITAMSWVYVDVIAQAIANLQSKCTASTGATNLWGWNQDLSNEPTTTWADEVYLCCLKVVFKIACEWRHSWTEFEPPTTSGTTVLESEFIERLIDRLALVSQATLAASRLLCALLEESGMSVMQAVYEMRQPNICVGRIVQSAEFYASTMQPPEVQTLCNITGSMMSNLYSDTFSHVQNIISIRAVEDLAAAIERITRMRRIYAWLYDVGDVGENSLQTCLSSILTAMETDHDKNTDLYRLGEAICAAENDRLQISNFVEEVVLPPLLERDALWGEFDMSCKQLTPDDLDLLSMKEEYALDWPASSWPLASVCGPSGANIRLADALTTRINDTRDDISLTLDRVKAIAVSLCSEDMATITTGKQGAQRQPVTNKSKRKRKTNMSMVLSNVVTLEPLRRTLSAFQKDFLSELRPLIRHLARVTELYVGVVQEKDTEIDVIGETGLSPDHPWSIWLTNQNLWMEAANRLLEAFTKLLTQLGSAAVAATSFTNPAITATVEAVLVDVRLLRQRLMPDLISTIPLGIGAVLGGVGNSQNADDESISEDVSLLKAAVAEVGFDLQNSTLGQPGRCAISQSNETDTDHRVTAPPSSLQRICDRLAGCDEFLGCSPTARMSVGEQTSVCIQAAADPDNLCSMFEGWTPWV